MTRTLFFCVVTDINSKQIIFRIGSNKDIAFSQLLIKRLILLGCYCPHELKFGGYFSFCIAIKLKFRTITRLTRVHQKEYNIRS